MTMHGSDLWLIDDFTLFWHIWPNLITKWREMTILSCKTIFGLTFSAILENLLELFFRKVPKTVILAIFWHVWPKSAKMKNFIKNRPCYFFTLIVPQLYGKFRKNPWSGFRDQLRDGERTDGQGWYYRTGRFAGSKIQRNLQMLWNLNKKQVSRGTMNQHHSSCHSF